MTAIGIVLMWITLGLITDSPKPFPTIIDDDPEPFLQVAVPAIIDDDPEPFLQVVPTIIDDDPEPF